jgi:S-adenosylmethionine synthetase
MIWIIKIENKPQLRILVELKPSKNKLIFSGECRTKNRLDSWTAVKKIIIDVDENLPQTFESTILEINDVLNEKIQIIDQVESFMGKIKKIDFMDEEEFEKRMKKEAKKREPPPYEAVGFVGDDV